MGRFPGWRTMTGAQRYNAKAAAMFEQAKAQGHTGFRSMTIAARDVKVGDVLEGYGRVDQVEADDSNVVIGWEVVDGVTSPERADPQVGDWSDFKPGEKVVRMNKESAL